MARRHGFTALLPGDFGISDIFAGMLGLAYGSGLNFADNDSQLAVGICGNLVQPLIGDLKGRILEHRHQLFIQLFYDLIPRYQKFGFKWGETNVEMETNEKVQSQWQYLEHIQHKRRRCYKKPI